MIRAVPIILAIVGIILAICSLLMQRKNGDKPKNTIYTDPETARALKRAEFARRHEYLITAIVALIASMIGHAAIHLLLSLQ